MIAISAHQLAYTPPDGAAARRRRARVAMPVTTRASSPRTKRNARTFAALPSLTGGARPPDDVGTDPTKRHKNGTKGPSRSAPTSPAGRSQPDAGRLARMPAAQGTPLPVPEHDPVPPAKKTKFERLRQGTDSLYDNTAMVFERLGQLVGLVKPTAEGFNHARFPVTTCVFILTGLTILLTYALSNRAIDLSFAQAEAAQRTGLYTRLTERCVDDDHLASCKRLDALLHINSSAIEACPEADPPPADCWKAGPAIQKAGAADATALTVAQAAAAYAEIVRPLPTEYITRTDLQAFVREEIDLNRDGMVTRYELYAGLAKLIRREQWHDTYANGLWVIPAA